MTPLRKWSTTNSNKQNNNKQQLSNVSGRMNESITPTAMDRARRKSKPFFLANPFGCSQIHDLNFVLEHTWHADEG